MNKRQKEVIQHQLDSEKAVLAQIEKQYKRALNDINNKIRIYQSDELTPSRIYHIQYQKALKKQVTAILEKLHSDEFSTIQQFLSNSYIDAFIGTFYDIAGQGIPIITPVDQKAAVKAIMTDTRLNKPLYDELGVDVNELKKAVSAEITRGLASGSTYEDMARNLSFKTKAPLARANTIIRTESHRIQQASAEDARQVSKSKGADVVKQWDATLDGDTRPTHRELDGQIRETDEPFEANGKEAMYPGDFGDPAEDCNCRCVALTRARWALDEDELQKLKARAAYFKLDKTKEFEGFKGRFLHAAKVLETPAETGQLAIPYSKRGIEIEKRLQGYLKELNEDGEYIERQVGEIKIQDLAVLTTETGVEYTLLNIGSKSILIRGERNRTTIKQELVDLLVKNKGTLECHSHPYVGDLIPSEADRKFLKLLPWQEESVIIEPGQETMRYNLMGTLGSLETKEKRDNDYYAFMFEEGD